MWTLTDGSPSVQAVLGLKCLPPQTAMTQAQMTPPPGSQLESLLKGADCILTLAVPSGAGVSPPRQG